MKKVSPQVDFVALEKEVLARWQKDGAFEESNDQRAGKKEFNFYDGPPFANGLPHYGHMLGQTLKDIVPRYWNMRGYAVDRRFGWDCHGLPVEYEVEKKLELNGRQDIVDLGVDKFNEACRETVFHYAEEWKKTITRLGRWVDWDNQYRTMDLNFMESVWWVFKELHKKNLVYRDMKIVSYSPRITAVVSNFEANLNYKDVQDPSVCIKFKLKDEDAYVIAWTTTPWTLISNLALGVGEGITYAKVKVGDEIHYVGEKRLEFTYGKIEHEVIGSISGLDLIGRSYVPLFDYFKDHENGFVIRPADFVTEDAGTGIAHCAPAYGEDDFAMCKKHSIALVDPLDETACFTSEIPELKGTYIKDADKLIMKMLKDKGNVLKHETFVHSYPHCDRTEDPLIYRAIPTWYINVEKIKERLCGNNQKINWVPSHLKDGRMGKWLENARDWAVSRNRFWGTPIPIWVNENDSKDFEVVGSIEELEKKSGQKVDDLHKHKIDHLTWMKGQDSMKRVPEVFDCWFESGSMPYAQKHYPFENKDRFKNTFPADFIAEGQDQTRGWFYTLAILSTALFDVPAFKNVVVNGIVLAKDGKKMSKRLKNYTAPDILLDKYGADSVRLYMVNSPVLRGDDLRFSDEGVKDTTRSVLIPLWNAQSFLTTYAAADNWSPSGTFDFVGVENELDCWILSRLQTLEQTVQEHMESYKIYLVVPAVLGFIDDLTNWYIRLSRRRFWGDGGVMSRDTASAYETLHHCIKEFCKVFAPFAPFVTDQIYKNLTDLEKSVHLADMPLPDSKLIDKSVEDKMTLIRNTTGLARSLRAKHKLKTRQVLPSLLVITGSESDRKHIESGFDILRDEINVKEVMFSSEEDKYVSRQIKPNLKLLGKKLGKGVKSLKQECENINSDAVRLGELLKTLESGGKVNLIGHDLELADFLIDRGPKDDRLIATDAGVTVLLDTKLTPKLIEEGLSRELVNRVQKFRKDIDLEVSDRINIALHTSEVSIRKATESHMEFVKQETLCVQLSFLDQKSEQFKYWQSINIEGIECNIGISISS